MIVPKDFRPQIEAIAETLSNGGAIDRRERMLIGAFILDALRQHDKVREIEAYLNLPKFDGVEHVWNRCQHCDKLTETTEARNWVSIKDIKSRLD